MSNKQQKQRKSTAPTTERRFLANGELRVRDDGNGKKIVGYAAKFDVLSEDLGSFREKIAPHAFDDTLAANVDCRALWNHDPNHILARTASGTLRLSVDDVGLFYEIDPPDTTLARDLMVSLARKDVTQSSFAFLCTSDDWQVIGDQVIRTVLKAELLDVSPVTYAAYPDATSAVRTSLQSCPADLRARLERSDDDDDDDLDCDGADADDPGCDEDRCDCRCAECRADNCEACSNAECSDDNCSSCPVQEREARYSLLLRRMR